MNVKRNRTQKLTLSRETVVLLQGQATAAAIVIHTRDGKPDCGTFTNTKMPEDCCL
jgi:hypothetical protein